MVQIEACQAKGERQCVKDAQAPTMQRKIRELRYAIAMEKKFTKDQILERYLNIAYYGEGAYGVEAAARHYFSTKAASSPCPRRRCWPAWCRTRTAHNPVDNLGAALDRRDVVINRMAELKMITPDQVKKAKTSRVRQEAGQADPQRLRGHPLPVPLRLRLPVAAADTPSLGKTVKERENMVKRGGLVIQTAIDPKTQDLAQQKVSAVVGPKDPVISTMNMIQPGTGLIIAMAQSRPVMGGNAKKGQTYWNLAVEPAMGGIQGYQAGSTFKAFTLAAALEKGIPISKKFNARSPINFSGRTFETCRGRERGVRPMGRAELGRAQQDHRNDPRPRSSRSTPTSFSWSWRPACAGSPRWPRRSA